MRKLIIGTVGTERSSAEEFSDLLHAAFRDGMTNVLGESGLRAVVFHFPSGEYPKAPRELHRNMDSIFKEGATVLEKIIVKELFRRLNLRFEEEVAFDFEKYVNRAREIFEGAARRKEDIVK